MKIFITLLYLVTTMVLPMDGPKGKDSDPELVFIYNANSGLFSAITDYVHKMVSPETYDCNLCGITYDNLGMKNEWKSYLESLPIAYRFTYRNLLTDTHLRNIALPAIAIVEEETTDIFLSAEIINGATTVSELISLINTELKKRGLMARKTSLPKTEAEWKDVLSPEEYHVLREKGTERAFTGKYDEHFDAGTYTCAGCETPLFHSDTKYNSGCGWPAFFNFIPGTITEHLDTSHGMVRTEVTCSNCGGHLGHVFTDGPDPTGLRYCINSISLHFVPDTTP